MSIKKNYNFDELKEPFEGAKTIINEYGTLTEDTVNFKLNPETWSCTEVCQHLIRFNEMYFSEIDQAIEKQKTIPVSKNGSSFSPKWTVRKLAGYLEPPYKFGIKTLRPMYPANVKLSAENTFIRLIEINEEIITLLNKAEKEQWNLNKIKGKHPLLKIYRMSLMDYLIFIDAHQRRHFWQIEQILARIPE
ncbi:MAG: hypothetical protein WD381_02315 [Balneolaceae bacterium]